jgi:hypothetical protein
VHFFVLVCLVALVLASGSSVLLAAAAALRGLAFWLDTLG